LARPEADCAGILAVLSSVVAPDLPFNRWLTAHEHGLEVRIAREDAAGPPGVESVAEVATRQRNLSLLTDFRSYEKVFASFLGVSVRALRRGLHLSDPPP
jgi:hypothetical protein